MPRPDFFGVGPLARRNRHRIKSRLPISNQVTIIDDESAPEDTNAPILPFRQRRVDIQLGHSAGAKIGNGGRQINPHSRYFGLAIKFRNC